MRRGSTAKFGGSEPYSGTRPFEGYARQIASSLKNHKFRSLNSQQPESSQ
jgi:hypothetical protein